MQHHGGFPDAGSCGEYGEVSGLPASGCFVELVKSGRDAGGLAFCGGFHAVGISLVNVVAGLVYGFCAVVGVETLCYGVDGFAGLFEEVGDVDGLVGGLCEEAVQVCGEEPPGVCFLDVEGMGDDVCRRGYAGEDGCHENGVFFVWQSILAGFFEYGYHVDSLGAVVECQCRGVEVGALRRAEHVGREHVGDFVYGLAFEDNGSDDGFFGFFVVKSVTRACSIVAGFLLGFHFRVCFFS